MPFETTKNIRQEIQNSGFQDGRHLATRVISEKQKTNKVSLIISLREFPSHSVLLGTLSGVQRTPEFRRVENLEEKVARILKAEHQRGKKYTERKLQRSSEVLRENPADISEDSRQR